MTRIADSSVLYAAFDQSDDRRPEALDALSDPEPIEVPPEVLAETLGVFQRRHGFTAAARLWEQLRRIPHLTLLQESDSVQISEVFLHVSPRLSWVDACVLSWCRAKGARLLAFDDALETAFFRGP